MGVGAAGWRRRRPATAPDCPAPTPAEVRALCDFIGDAQRLLVITGKAWWILL
jgi:hypothetical protein